jgi:hypothetical protein
MYKHTDLAEPSLSTDPKVFHLIGANSVTTEFTNITDGPRVESSDGSGEC